MSKSKGDKPHSDHPHEDEFEFEMHEPVADESPHGLEHLGHRHAEHEHAAGEHDPLDALGINASSEEFQFAGPAEELDFTEPADFTFPTEHAEAEATSDSSAEFAAHEHGGLDHLFGGEETAPHEAIGDGAVSGEEAAVEEMEPVAVAAEGELGEAEVEKKPKPKREMPAWVRTLEWVTVSLLAVIGLIAPIVAIVWIADPKDKNSADTVSLIVNICFPMLLLLVPYALWRSSRRWTTPAASALYTVLLAIGTAALIGGSWVEATELSRMKWQFNKTRIAAGKPPVAPIPVFETPAPAPAPAEQK